MLLKGSTEVSISIERLSGKELLGIKAIFLLMREEKLKSSDYQDKIKQVKLWAVCDKTVEEFGLENIYASENEATR